MVVEKGSGQGEEGSYAELVAHDRVVVDHCFEHGVREVAQLKRGGFFRGGESIKDMRAAVYEVSGAEGLETVSYAHLRSPASRVNLARDDSAARSCRLVVTEGRVTGLLTLRKYTLW